MKIAVAGLGRFHMFDLARELSRLGETVQLFTGMPRFRIEPELQPMALMRPQGLLTGRLVSKLMGYVPGALEFLIARDFGRWISRSVGKGKIDIFDALDGMGLEAGPKIQDGGGIWVCNRGSAHVLKQKALLEEEFGRWHRPLPAHYFYPACVERSLMEYDRADCVVVPSEFARSSFLEYGVPAGKVHVCPYGVDLSMFRPMPRQDSRFRVLFVGALSLQKGIEYLLEAARSAKVELWLVGQALREVRPILERYSGTYSHLGTCARHELAWYYSQASVLVLPSIQDGFGLVLAQAMACGVPVIATTNTAGTTLFSDGIEGFVVPPRSPDAIRERIQWMLDNPERRREMGDAALRRVRKIGGWASYGRDCRAMYDSVRQLRAAARSAAF